MDRIADIIPLGEKQLSDRQYEYGGGFNDDREGRYSIARPEIEPEERMEFNYSRGGGHLSVVHIRLPTRSLHIARRMDEARTRRPIEATTKGIVLLTPIQGGFTVGIQETMGLQIMTVMITTVTILRGVGDEITEVVRAPDDFAGTMELVEDVLTKDVRLFTKKKEEEEEITTNTVDENGMCLSHE